MQYKDTGPRSTAQHDQASTAQHSTAQHSTAQHSTAQRSAAQPKHSTSSCSSMCITAAAIHFPLHPNKSQQQEGQYQAALACPVIVIDLIIC